MKISAGASSAAPAIALALLLLSFFLTPFATADGPGRIYTQPQAGDTAIITGTVKGAALSHAIAVERDRTRVYLAKLDADATGFRFENLPVGRYDLVLVTRDNRVFEGLELGADLHLAKQSAANLATGVAVADSFFNRHQIHRSGVGEGGALVFVERIRDGQILRGSGEVIDANLRRLEIIEFREAGDDWQMVRSRHLFREETPKSAATPFLRHRRLPALTNLRVGANPRQLGTIDLTNT